MTKSAISIGGWLAGRVGRLIGWLVGWVVGCGGGLICTIIRLGPVVRRYPLDSIFFSNFVKLFIY